MLKDLKVISNAVRIIATRPRAAPTTSPHIFLRARNIITSIKQPAIIEGTRQ